MPFEAYALGQFIFISRRQFKAQKHTIGRCIACLATAAAAPRRVNCCHCSPGTAAAVTMHKCMGQRLYMQQD